jgi:ABC-type multidrug transport system ATPase subunit
VGEPALVAADEAVSVAGFRKAYGERLAVDGADLSVRRGEVFGLIGPDGAGKSSLLKAIAGVLRFDQGTVSVFGTELSSDEAAEGIKGRLGFMAQGLGTNLYPELSIEENVDFFARLRGVPDAELGPRKESLLAMTRLLRFRGRPVRQLSGGMKQKLGLVCTLIHLPELILLDEPTTGVDPVSRRDFWAALAGFRREREVTAIISTAYLDEASRFHRLSLLYAGRVLAEGEPESVRRLVAGTLVRVEAEPQAEALERLRGRFPQVQPQGRALHVFVDDLDAGDAEGPVRDAIRGLEVRALSTDVPELDDLFVALLRRRGLVPPPPPRMAAAAGPGGGAAIEARGLTRDFGRFRAVDRVSLEVAPGEVFGLLGANGAGKTTVIKMLTGILAPTEGTGHVAGADMRHAPRAIKRRIGYVSQSFSLYQDLTVLENIRLYAAIYGLGRAETRERVRWIVGLGGLGGHEQDAAGRLPVGMRQRLALGCALVHDPRVLFLDEPTSGVDPVGRRRFWDILFELSRARGVAILITTHAMTEAEQCDRLGLLFDGRLVADAPPERLKLEVEREAGRLIAFSPDQPERAVDVLARAGYHETALFGRSLHVLAPDPDATTRRVKALLAAEGIRTGPAQPRALSMEDVFAYRVGVLERRAEEEREDREKGQEGARGEGGSP